jgi:DNA topoisomerase II
MSHFLFHLTDREICYFNKKEESTEGRFKPILRAIKGQQTKLFYNEGEYNTWKSGLPEQSTAGWTIKYFKGLGTSSSTEFKEYFANKKVVDFVYTDATTDDVIDKIFNKKRPDERKLWLSNYNKSSYLNTTLPQVKYEEFIDKELIHFSVYDCFYAWQ